MDRPALLQRVVGPACLLAAAVSLVATGWVATTQSDAERDSWDERLRAAALAVAGALQSEWPTHPNADAQDRARAIAEATRLRITLIGPAGVVLADSELDDLDAVRALESHAGRVEVVEARRSGAGWRTGVSATTKRRYRYHAVRLDPAGQPSRVVRVAAPLETIRASAAAASRDAWIAGLAITAAFTAALAVVLSLGTKPVRALANAAEKMAAGSYEERWTAPGYFRDELADLSASLAEMGKRLAKREYQLARNWQTQLTVLESMTEGVIAVDDAEQVLFCNRSAGRALGFNPSAVEGRTLLEAVRSHELRDACQQAIRKNKPQEREIAWRSGKSRVFQAHASPMPGEPCPGAVLVVRDVSELKRLENLRQQFIANVSHELKTPLSSIKAYAETLLNGALQDPDNAELFLRRIDEQSDRLNQLVMDMLSLARLEAGEAAVEVTTVPIARVATRCVADFEQLATAASVRVTNLAADSPLAVRADENALWEILSNLIDNAVKYTPPGGEVTVTAEPIGEMAAIRVTDTGPGIAPEHHERLFERFYRVDRARSRELGGTGLGLSIVKHLSATLGGSVTVQSQLGAGSVFTVRLPLASD